MPYSSSTTQVISCDTVSQQSIIEQVVAIIATRFINVSPDTLDNEIVNALDVIGKVTGVDRCCIVLLEDDEVTIKKCYEWYLDNHVSTDADSTYVSLLPFKWFLDKLSSFETLHIPQILELPSEADFEKTTWLQKGIISLVAVPLVLNDVL
ncbi:MAG: hypothetical protein JW981_04975, partial [Anaerolineae bacterium]|nr:hypothetical protein [Anaerolineae bacterium]